MKRFEIPAIHCICFDMNLFNFLISDDNGFDLDYLNSIVFCHNKILLNQIQRDKSQRSIHKLVVYGLICFGMGCCENIVKTCFKLWYFASLY